MLSFRQVFAKYLQFVTRRKWRYYSALLLLVVQAAANTALPLLYGQIVDFVSAEQFEFVGQAIATLTFVLLLVLFADQLRFIISDRILLEDLFMGGRLEYVSKLHAADYSYHTSKSSGSLISLAKRGDSAFFTAFHEINGNSFRLVIEFLIATLVLFSINYVLGLVMVGVIGFSLLVGVFLVRINVARRKLANAEDDKITGITVDNMVGFQTVKIFATEEQERKRFIEAFQPWKRAQFSYIISFRWLDVAMGLISAAGYVFILYFGLNLVQSGELGLGVFVAALVFIFNISRQITNLVYKIRELGKTYADLVKYFEVMAIEPEIKSPLNPVPFPEAAQAELIEFRGVYFTYTSGVNMFSGLDLEINPGEKIALVGKSGAGKTTLTKLLMRFHDPSQGQIRIGGVDIREFDLTELRKHIGLVPQEPVLFNESMLYNLTYGNQTASEAEIASALARANLTELIEELPQGLDTIVGERGIKLSGGQKQRLAIARVFLENPPIIIFDEATSQLDSENERQIQDAYLELAEGRTTITIAHRLSTVVHSDRIIVFSGGEIAQQGKHAELLSQDGIYKQLWELQSHADAMI